MSFGCKVETASFNDDANAWTIQPAEGEPITAKYFCTAIGMLSAATPPRIEGIDDFEGEAFHTYYWPKEPVDLEGKRVAVIGTGATGVQVIGAIADRVGSLTVFQRRPNWCAPLHNSKISDAEMAEIKSRYDEIFAQCRATPNGFLHGPDRRIMKEVPREERLAFWDKLYASPGFGVWLGNFRDILMDPEANQEFSEYMANRIRQRVHDPETAELLIPKDHGFGSRRVPMETRYYEAYNRDNVKLVDLNATPISRIDATGIETTAEHFDFDVIIFATGFDAITGSFDRINIEGVDGARLRDKWFDGPETYLGLQVAGFPNMFTLAGPQGASVSSNFPPAIETAVEWASELIAHTEAKGHNRVEASQAAEDEWLDHVRSFYEDSILATTKSWFTGYNSNVDGHDKLRHMVYLGGAPAYRNRLAEIAANDYPGFEFH
jgi:cation diffusion facilitator CzcD-associated flavoprotein CzcO